MFSNQSVVSSGAKNQPSADRSVRTRLAVTP